MYKFTKHVSQKVEKLLKKKHRVYIKYINQINEKLNKNSFTTISVNDNKKTKTSKKLFMYNF